MLALFALAIVPRAVWVAYNDRAPQGSNDPTLYALFADTIADGHGYIRPTGEKTAYYPVGYPATVAGLKKAGDIFGWDRSIFSIKMMNGMFVALDRPAGLPAGEPQSPIAVRASQRGVGRRLPQPRIYPYTGTVLSEPLFTFMWIGALTVLLWKPWSRDGMPWYQLLGAGLLLSYATMTRGITLMFPLVLLGVWLFCICARRSVRWCRR